MSNGRKIIAGAARIYFAWHPKLHFDEVPGHVAAVPGEAEAVLNKYAFHYIGCEAGPKASVIKKLPGKKTTMKQITP